jgi:hypothetical protein
VFTESLPSNGYTGHNILVGKTEGNTAPKRPRSGEETNIKMLLEIEYADVDRFHLTQDEAP